MTSKSLSEFDPLATAKPPSETLVSPVKQDDAVLNEPVSVTTATHTNPSNIGNDVGDNSHVTACLGSHGSHVTNTVSTAPTNTAQSITATSHDGHVTMIPSTSNANSVTPTTSKSHESHVTNSSMSPDSHVTPLKQPYTGEFIPLDVEQTTRTEIKSNSSNKQTKKANDAVLQTHPQSQVTMTTTNQNPVAGMGHASSEKIGAEISEIDSFLKSLNMGHFDALSSQGQMQPLPQQQAPLPKQQAPLPKQQAPLPKQQAPDGNVTTLKVSEIKKEPTPIKSSGLRLIGQFGSGDSGSSSDSDSSSESSDEEPVLIIKKRVGGDGSDSDGDMNKDSRHGYPKVKGEIDYRDLPTDECHIPFPEDGTLLPIGKISHYAEKLVVIQALPNTPPIDEGTVLWSKDRISVARVFETFGPVKTPLYSIKVESEDHASSLGLTIGALVYVTPGNLELTKYVFTQQLMKQKGSDASWKNDSEVPVQFKDFSDDETEQASKRKHTAKRQRGQDKSGPCSKSQTSSQHHQQSSSHRHASNTANTNSSVKVDYSYNPKMSSYFPRGTTLLSPQSFPPPTVPPQHAIPPQNSMAAQSLMSGGYGLRGQGQIYTPYPHMPPQGMMYPRYPSYGVNMMDYASHYFHSGSPMQQGQPQRSTTGSVTMTTQSPSSQSQHPTSN